MAFLLAIYGHLVKEPTSNEVSTLYSNLIFVEQRMQQNGNILPLLQFSVKVSTPEAFIEFNLEKMSLLVICTQSSNL